MVEPIQNVKSSNLVNKITDAHKNQAAQKNNNIDMQPKSPQYIETMKYIESRQEICANDKDLREVFKNVDCIIGQDGSVRFQFKSEVNIEQFKKAFGFEDGCFRRYLKNRHDNAIKNGTVHAHYTNGNETDYEQLTDYELGGIGSRITYTDGYTQTKGYRGGWINRSKIVDKPDYTNMSLGPEDNEKLPTYGKDFFNYDD